MSWILGLLGIPVLIKRISDLEDEVDELEQKVNQLRHWRQQDLQRLRLALQISERNQ